MIEIKNEKHERHDGIKKIFLDRYMNEITVMADDGEGNEWWICTIRENEPLLLHAALPKDFFIPTNEQGCVETYEEP